MYLRNLPLNLGFQINWRNSKAYPILISAILFFLFLLINVTRNLPILLFFKTKTFDLADFLFLNNFFTYYSIPSVGIVWGIVSLNTYVTNVELLFFLKCNHWRYIFPEKLSGSCIVQFKCFNVPLLVESMSYLEICF